MRAWQANLVGVGTAGLVVASGLLLSAPDAIADGPANPRTLSAPPSSGNAVGEIPVGDSIMLAGRPSKLSVFWTSDPTDKIVRTYQDSWAKADLYPEVKVIDRVTGVSAVDSKTGLMRVVTIIDQGQERMVLPNITDIRVAPQLSPRSAPVPVPEGVSQFMGHTADDTTSLSYNATYRAPYSSEQMIAFYQAELGREGYQVSEAKKSLKGGAVIEFTRGLEWIWVVATDEPQLDAAQGTASSLMVVTHVRSYAPPTEWTP